MGGRSRPTERMHKAVELKDLKIYLGPQRRKNLAKMGIRNMDELFFYTNKGFSNACSLDTNLRVVKDVCEAFGYTPSRKHLLRIREFAGLHLTDDFIKKRDYDSYCLRSARDEILNIRSLYGLPNPCERLG